MTRGRQSGVPNILFIWDQADGVDFSEGMLAYSRYRETLDGIARHYHIPLASVVGMFCALSPNNAYMTNLRSVVDVLNGGRGSGYGACYERALRCMRGEDFLWFTKGPKTRSFYQNIMDPDDPEPVTIDGHAYSVYVGQYHNMKQVVRAGFDYEQIATSYRQAAHRIGNGVLPNQVQAVCWFVWKRIHRVLFDAQMNLLRMDNQWQVDMEPDDITPFHK